MLTKQELSAVSQDAHSFQHGDQVKKSSAQFWKLKRFREACCCAPLAVPLDREVPVARGFRRLHAPGARGDSKADQTLLQCLGRSVA